MYSSQKAFDLIVAEEVTSQALYVQRYQRPSWPGGESGVTVGIGYDLGYSDAAKIERDWAGSVPHDVIVAMQSVAGIKRDAARRATAAVRSRILVPWAAALHVFENVDMPRWEQIVTRSCPRSAALPPDCFGVIVSLAFNRGASFSKAGDRYAEMRNIRAHIFANEYEKIPAEIRSMKRIWPKVVGLRNRREHEAVLFEHGLIVQPIPVMAMGEDEPPENSRLDSGDDPNAPEDPTPVTAAGNVPLNVQPDTTTYKLEDEILQRKLVGMDFHEVGTIDGKWGGRLVGGITAFMNDRGRAGDVNIQSMTAAGTAPQVVLDEVNKAISENWTRPIAPSRANATAKDIAPKIESVNQTWYVKLWGWALGLPAAAGAAFKAIFGDYNDPASTIYTVKSFFSAIPAELYLVIVAGFAGLVVYFATKSQNATVKAFNKGEIN